LCKWRSMYRTDYVCKVPAQPGSDFCIFHERGTKNIDEFESKLADQIRMVGDGDERNQPHDWTGYVFPRTLNLARYGNIDNTITLGEAVIKGNLNCTGAALTGGIYLWKAVILGDAIFKRATLGPKGVSIFFGARIEGRLRMLDASFLKDTDFDGCTAMSLQLGRGRPKMWGKNRRGLQHERPGTGESFWRFASSQFDREGRRAAADAAHYFERIARWRVRLRIPFYFQTFYDQKERRRKSIRFILAKIPMGALWLVDLILLRWTTAYGASLSRLFGTWALLMGSFSSVYYLLQRMGISLFSSASTGLDYPFSFGRALYFSIVTFTTLGYGDIVPLPGLGSVLVAAEAILGGITMALTVMVIGRKFMR